LRAIFRSCAPSNFAGRNPAHERRRRVDARDELGEALLVVLDRRRLAAGKASGRPAREVARDLHLLREREHVRKESGIQEHGLVDLLRGRMRGGLFQDGLEVAEHPEKLGTDA
jgi:hypothetical protein